MVLIIRIICIVLILVLMDNQNTRSVYADKLVGFVLILVLMDNQNTVMFTGCETGIDGLNPCSNG